MAPTLDDLRRVTATFADHAADADPDAPVASCPGWSVARLRARADHRRHPDVVIGPEGSQVRATGPAGDVLLRRWHRPVPTLRGEDEAVRALLDVALTP